MKRKFDVLLAGYYGFGNLGDELLLQSCIQKLQENNIPKERIAVLSATPEETAKRFGVAAFDRWSVIQIARAVAKSRSLLLGGGGLFQDTTSTKSCFYYWMVVKLARANGANVWTLGQSVGPLSTIPGKFFTKSAFSSCLFRGVRDVRSVHQLEEWKLSSVLTPDLVMGLRLKKQTLLSNILLLNVRPWHGPLAENAAVLAQKTAEKRGWIIRGVGFSPEDAALLEELQTKKIVKLHEIALVKSLEDFQNITFGTVGAVGMRLHFIVLSLLAGFPLAAVPYDPKVDLFRMEYNIPVIDNNGEELTFSDAPYGDVADKCGALIDKAFRDGLCAVLGETE